jgi:hypothetical protein
MVQTTFFTNVFSKEQNPIDGLGKLFLSLTYYLAKQRKSVSLISEQLIFSSTNTTQKTILKKYLLCELVFRDDASGD